MTAIAASPTAFLYVETDVPPGQTLGQWRHEHAEPHHSVLRSLLDALRGRG